MGSVGVRTAAGGVLSLEVTPADVIGRCDRCCTTFREGDWYCRCLAARYGHAIAWLDDRGSGSTGVPLERVASPASVVRPAGFAVTFESPAI